jgi:D-alanyl-lipoteichoic acid acyltransferase DltB (MBOAT superfamily)
MPIEFQKKSIFTPCRNYFHKPFISGIWYGMNIEINIIVSRIQNNSLAVRNEISMSQGNMIFPLMSMFPGLTKQCNINNKLLKQININGTRDRAPN